jgi:hypothetical protein
MRSIRPCSFHNTSRGCRNGSNCKFSHEGPSGASSESSNDTGFGRGGGRGRGRGRGFAAAAASSDAPGGSWSGGRGSSGSSSSAAKQLLGQLGSCLDPPPDKVQRWAHLALQQCDKGQAGYILKDLRGPDGNTFLRAAALQMSQPNVSPAGLGTWYQHWG